MPVWLIRTRDDQGNTELVKVRAESAAAAVRLAEVDLALVYSIKNEMGTGRGKHERLRGQIQGIALFAGSFFFCGVIWLGMDEPPIIWSNTNSLGHAIIIGLGVIFALALVVVNGFRLVRFVKRRKGARDAEHAQRAEVLSHKSRSAELAQGLLDHPAVRVNTLLVAMVVGIGVIVQLYGGETVEPFMIVMPLFLLWAAACPPFSELS